MFPLPTSRNRSKPLPFVLLTSSPHHANNPIIWLALQCLLLTQRASASTTTGEPHQLAEFRHFRFHGGQQVARAEALALTQDASSSAVELPDFEEPIGNHTVAIGKDVQLSCKINNLSNYRAAWLRVEDKDILTIHNNVITRNYRVGLINSDDGKTFVLTIKNVQPSDKGGYMCQINSVPMRYSVGYLDVLTPPKFDDTTLVEMGGPTSGDIVHQSEADAVTSVASSPGGAVVSVNEGANASLTCQASGHPVPTITWRREDQEPILTNGAQPGIGVSKVEGHTLFVWPVSRLNSGAYLCIASNGIQPSASRRQVLEVQFAPVLLLPQTEVAAYAGQRLVRLTCVVESKPLASVHWVKLGADSRAAGSSDSDADLAALIEHDELTSSDKYDIVIKQVNSEKTEALLNIRQVDKRDFANYKCIARNPLGNQSNVVRLHEIQASGSDYRVGGRASSTSSQGSDQGVDQQQNDQQPTSDGSSTGNRASNSAVGRTHPRSSWLQRPSTLSSSSNRNEPSSSSSVSLMNSMELFSSASQGTILLLLCNLLIARFRLN